MDASSLQERPIGVRTVNGRMAHGAGLILLRLVVRRPARACRRKTVALQAGEVHLADPQKARIGGTVRRVATAAPFGLHRQMLVGERSLFVGMAFEADRIPGRRGPRLAYSARAVGAVAVAALDQPLVHPVVVRLAKVCFGRLMTP